MRPVMGLIYGYNAFSSIQSAVNAVSVGGTVNVLAGQYAESVKVDKSVSLVGTNATNDPTNGGARGAETVLMPAVAGAVPYSGITRS